MWLPAEVAGTAPSAEPVVVHHVNAGYPAVFSIRLAAGRLLDDTDVTARRSVAVVNDRFVRARFEGRPPLGQIVRLPRLKDRPFDLANDAFEVVGSCTICKRRLTNPVRPEIYLPPAHRDVDSIVVRTTLDPRR
jgi:hypothetical protein